MGGRERGWGGIVAKNFLPQGRHGIQRSRGLGCTVQRANLVRAAALKRGRLDGVPTALVLLYPDGLCGGQVCILLARVGFRYSRVYYGATPRTLYVSAVPRSEKHQLRYTHLYVFCYRGQHLPQIESRTDPGPRSSVFFRLISYATSEIASRCNVVSLSRRPKKSTKNNNNSTTSTLLASTPSSSSSNC